MTTETLHELALFAGAGGGILGGRLLGWRTVCAVERDPYAAAVLAARQDDGSLHPFPIWDDVCSFNGRPWRGRVDVISGGFPCQDISVAGRGTGISGERSGLWSEFARIIREVGPRFVFVENSPALTLRGLDVVLGDLAALGYDAAWGVLGADDAGAPHRRKRIWIVGQLSDPMHGRRRQPVQSVAQRKRSPASDARRDGAARLVAHATNNRAGRRQQQPESGEGAGDVANCESGRREARGLPVGTGAQEPVTVLGSPDVGNTDRPGQREQWRAVANEPEQLATECASWWESEPDVDRVVNGLAHRVDRLRAIGNGQVPAVAALAWNVLTQRLNGDA